MNTEAVVIGLNASVDMLQGSHEAEQGMTYIVNMPTAGKCVLTVMLKLLTL
jgi:hypothetical protein